MILPLQLRPWNAPDAAPAAWFLPGHSAMDWLEELARCGWAGADTRLFVVPRSGTDPAPAGLLVVPAHPGSSPVRPRGLACRVLVDRLFVPLDAAVHPPVDEAELRALCPQPVSFLHPVFGLSGFDTTSTWRVWDLLAPPAAVAADWNQARPGPAPMPGLQAVVFARPPTLAELFGDAAGEIGVKPPTALPPSPNEPTPDTLARSGRQLRAWLAGGLSRLLSRMPQGVGAGSEWARRLRDWARRQMNRVEAQLEQLRHREIHRLLEMFERDPEAALRHAVPMNDAPHRGLAPPGAQLTARSPEFDAGRLGGGDPADPWAIPPDLQNRLRQRYREMADREVQLGRFRRAAYIYAELLGDLPSAANVLRQGRHYREAALVYEQHLNNPVAAAQCLAEGGLLAEAIERYQQLGRWLEVADLEERRGNRAAAEEALHRVINERVASDDILGAAQLVDRRLGKPDDALELLWRAWPASRQAAACLGQALRILGGLGRHEQVLERLARLSGQPCPRPLALPLLEVLSGLAREYPEERARHRLADFSRVLVARELTASMPPDLTSRLMDLLVRVAPEDRLLSRDASRFLADCREQVARDSRTAMVRPPGNQPVIESRFPLSRRIVWVRLRSHGRWFFAVGVSPRQCTLVRGVWTGETQSITWNHPEPRPETLPDLRSAGVLCEPLERPDPFVILGLPGGTCFPEQRFPLADGQFDQACMAGTPDWMQSLHWPVTCAPNAIWTAHVATSRAILSCHDLQGRLLRTVDVTQELLEGSEGSESGPVCLAALEGHVAVARGNRCVVTRSDGRLHRLELPGQVTRLYPTLPHTRPGFLILQAHGAHIHWLGTPGCIELDRDLAASAAAFVPGGPLALLTNRGLVLYEVDSRGVHGVTHVESPTRRLIDISATGGPGRLAALERLGEVIVWRLRP